MLTLMCNTLSGERPVRNRLEKDKREPKRTTRLTDAKAGSPTGGDTHGDGTPIVV